MNRDQALCIFCKRKTFELLSMNIFLLNLVSSVWVFTLYTVPVNLIQLCKLTFSCKHLKMLTLIQVKRSTKSTMMSPVGAESRCTGSGSITIATLAKTSVSTLKVAEELLEPIVMSTYSVTSLDFPSMTPLNRCLKIQTGLKPRLSYITEFQSQFKITLKTSLVCFFYICHLGQDANFLSLST